MRKEPKISVIVPVYNVENSLRKCLNSILSQTFTDFELLIVDDGSTDSSGLICDEFAELDPRVRVFHKTNGGVSSARNLGLENARGEWIAFCDSDDYTYPNWLDNYNIDKNDEYDLICQGFISTGSIYGINRNEDKVSVSFEGSTIDFYEQIAVTYSCVGYVWHKLFKRWIIKKYHLHFEEQVSFKEDEIFVIQYLTYCDKIKCVDNVGYFYYMPEWESKYLGKITKKDSLFCRDTRFRALEQLYCDRHESRIFCNEINSVVYGYILNFKYDYNRNHIKKIRQLLCRYPYSVYFNPYLKSLIKLDKSITLSWGLGVIYVLVKRLYVKLLTL